MSNLRTCDGCGETFLSITKCRLHNYPERHVVDINHHGNEVNPCQITTVRSRHRETARRRYTASTAVKPRSSRRRTRRTAASTRQRRSTSRSRWSASSYDSSTGELDVDIIEGTSKKDRDLRTQVRLVLESRDGKATTSESAEALEWDKSEAEHKLEKLNNSRIIYNPAGDSQDTWRMV